MNVIGIFREISKLVMFTAMWGFPLYLSRVTDSYGYLWFFFLSALFTIGMFSHYEELERIDKEDNKNE